MSGKQNPIVALKNSPHLSKIMLSMKSIHRALRGLRTLLTNCSIRLPYTRQTYCICILAGAESVMEEQNLMATIHLNHLK